jgi:hypothetical protein
MNPLPVPYANTQVFYRARRQAAFIINGAVNELAFYRRKDKDSKGISVATSRAVAEQNLTRVRDTITIEAAQVRGVRDRNNTALDVVPEPPTVGKANIVDVPYFNDPDDEQAAEGIRLAKILANLATAVLDAPA